MSITHGPDCAMKGDYLAWDSADWDYNNNTVRHFTIQKQQLCYKFGEKKMTKIGPRSQNDALHTCTKLNNGIMPQVETDEDLGKFYEFAKMESLTLKTMKNSNDLRFDYTLTPYIYHGGELNNSYYNIEAEELFQTPLPRIQPWQYDKVGQVAQQGPEDMFGPGMHWYLRNPDGFKEETTCISYGKLLFLVKGVCKSSFMWQFTSKPFHLVNKNNWGERGLFSNPENPADIVYFINEWGAWTIHFSFPHSSWELRHQSEDGSSKLLARVKSTLTSMALGTNMWSIYNDSKECNKNDGEVYSSPLSFSVCSEEQFTCDDGNCVPMENR